MSLIVQVKAKAAFFKGFVQNQVYKNGKQNVGNAENRENVMFRGMSPNIPGNLSGCNWIRIHSKLFVKEHSTLQLN